MVFLYRLNRKVYGIPVDSTNLLAMRFDFSMIKAIFEWFAGGRSRLAKPFYHRPRHPEVKLE